MRNTIETHQLTKNFGNTAALKDLNLTIPSGSICAFLGPNGAGKTTTIKILMNLLTPDTGHAEILGMDSRKIGPAQLSQIGYVSENQDLPLWMTVQQLLEYCKSMYASWDDSFCRQLLKQFDLPLHQKLSNLSRGMKMKASLASSLSYRPKLVVLDEPFSGLDPLVRQELVDGFLQITENQEWTIFISSHDIDEVERLADLVGIIDHGELKIMEKTESLTQRFKRMELTLDAATTEKSSLPATWLLYRQEGRAVCFIDSQYHEKTSGQQIDAIFAGHSGTVVSGMSLKEIFVALAKQYKLTNF